MLVLTVGLNVIGKSKAAAFSIAASLMIMIFCLGNVSGGHYNPAVTTAVLFRGKIDLTGAGVYWAVQILGGVCGAFTYYVLSDFETCSIPPPPGGILYSQGVAWFGEFIFTFLLASTVLNVATNDNPLTEYFGFAIGSCITIGGCALGNISGGSMNPAVTLSLWVSHGIISGNCSQGWIYIFFELLGGFTAAMYFRGMYTVKADKVGSLLG